MPKAINRTIRIRAKLFDGSELQVGAFAPAVIANIRMVDLRLRKAGLPELKAYLFGDTQKWIGREDAYETFQAAGQFFDLHPESIPFSDILSATFPGILQALDTIPEDSQVQFDLVEVGHAGLNHGSVVELSG